MALQGKTIDFCYSTEAVVHAPPEAVFEILCDFAAHDELAGSGELVTVRKLTEGPLALGSLIEADESIQLGDDLLQFTAQSVIVACDAPTTLSWLPVPPMPIRRIQWWFKLEPVDGDTRVTHEVEVDLGEEARDMFGGTEGYLAGRAVDVAQGMEETLKNLQKIAAG